VSGAMPPANPLPIGTRTHVRRMFGTLGAMCLARESAKKDGVIVLEIETKPAEDAGGTMRTGPDPREGSTERARLSVDAAS
jgi:hypothetical protein